LYPGPPGIPSAMTDLPMEDMDRTQREREADAEALLDGQREGRDGEHETVQEAPPDGE
jgi:hypothetical protein